jgi:hypothetical protein
VSETETVYKVFTVFCRIDGQTEYSDVFRTEQAARGFCEKMNAKPIYYGRYTWHPTTVRDFASDASEKP